MITWIHSDDMAATPHVTETMLQSWRDGALDGFSVIANGGAIEALGAGLRAEPARAARIGAHLNLSEGPSSAPADLVPLLVDSRGVLKHSFTTLIRAWYGSSAAGRRLLGEQIGIEWQTQIARVQQIAAPRSVAAVDGHMHVHMLPFLFGIAARLTADAGIPAIRISRESFYSSHGLRDWGDPEFYVSAIKHVVLRYCAAPAVAVARQHGLTAPDRLVGVLYTGRMTAGRAFDGIAAAARDGAWSVEVIFHVGRAEPSERERWSGREYLADFYLSPWRDRERAEALVLHRKIG